MLVRIACVLTCLFFGAIATLSHAADGQPGPKLGAKRHVLPKDKQAPVITFDYKGGFTPPRKSDAPMMTVLADGTVKLPIRFEGQKEFQAKLSADELHALLDEIITDQKFFEIDLEKARKGGLDQGGGIVVADAPTTVIRIEADGQTKELQQYALGFGGGQGSPDMKRLAAVGKRLQRLAFIVQLGGEAEVAKYLKLANDKLKADHPAAKPLTMADFQGGGQDANGRKTATFHRQTVNEQGEPQGDFTSVNIEHLAGAEPKLTTHYQPARDPAAKIPAPKAASPKGSLQLIPRAAN